MTSSCSVVCVSDCSKWNRYIYIYIYITQRQLLTCGYSIITKHDDAVSLKSCWGTIVDLVVLNSGFEQTFDRKKIHCISWIYRIIWFVVNVFLVTSEVICECSWLNHLTNNQLITIHYNSHKNVILIRSYTNSKTQKIDEFSHQSFAPPMLFTAGQSTAVVQTHTVDQLPGERFYVRRLCFPTSSNWLPFVNYRVKLMALSPACV